MKEVDMQQRVYVSMILVSGNYTKRLSLWPINTI